MIDGFSYRFYTQTYCGGMSPEAFSAASVRANAYLDTLTLGKSERRGLPDAVLAKLRLAACAVADAIVKNDSGVIASESNDGISVTYARAQDTDSQRLYNAAAQYLAPTGLLYRGVCI